MIDLNIIKDRIKDSVTVPDAVDHYTDSRIVHHRIPCPFHSGHDSNMRVYRDSYYCFVCHASGDVIRFVEDFFGLGFVDALRKLDTDFGIGLFNTELSRAELMQAEQERKRRAEQKAVERWNASVRQKRIETLKDIERTTDLIEQEGRPQAPWEPYSEVWCAAVRCREVVREEIESV